MTQNLSPEGDGDDFFAAVQPYPVQIAVTERDLKSYRGKLKVCRDLISLP